MQGPRNRSIFPVITYARVVGYDPTNHGVFVAVPSLQTISLSAKILVHGTADATRVNQEPLPVIGTHGLIAVPFGDSLSAIWLGSYYNSPINAVTTSQPTVDQDSQIKYLSHASGAWELLDYYGNSFTQYADGSSVAVNVSGVAPTVYANTVDTDNNQQSYVVTQASRNAYPPGPFYYTIKHSSGSTITITPSGTVTVSGVAKNTVVLDTSGNININTQESGSNININAQGGGNIVSIQSAQEVQFQVPAQGAAGTGTDDINHMWQLFNSHTHQNVQPGSGNSGTPTGTPTTGTVPSGPMGNES